MKKLGLILCLCVHFLSCLSGYAGTPEPFKGGTDGPHVFYRNGHVFVKSVEKRDTSLVLRSITYSERKHALLSCSIPETNDRFSFLLKDSLLIEPDQYELPEKMIVLSDIEGNFLAFKTMLLGARVINKDFKWIFGKGHLVLLGDYFDRGLNVTECLWLVYKLEQEAKLAGGKVHFILGNHEILNLQGNTEYVRQKYLANAKIMGESYPLWFDEDSELGRWLRTKNALEKIGDFLFCHGGISPELARTKMTISSINRISRNHLGEAQEIIPPGNARAVFDQQTGIFWCRTIAKSKISMEDLDMILAFYGGQRMVIGHTLVPDLTLNYGGRVICIDLYHEENLRRGFMKTLLIEDGICYGIDDKGEKSSVFTVAFPHKDESNKE